jgi:hypothetical protein
MHTDAIADLQRKARALGWLFTALAALMSGYAGWHLGGDSTYAAVLLAALFAGLTYAVAHMLSFIELAVRNNERAIASVLGAVFCLAAFGEYASHVAFQSSHRATNIERASIQNVRYDVAQDAMADSKASLAMWEKRLADLETANAWSAAVTAEALRAQLETAKLEVEREAARGGCKSVCLAKTKARDDLAARISIAEERSDLTRKIEATRTVLAKHRDKAVASDRGESIALNQSQLFATAATMSLAPPPSAVQWATLGIGAYIGLLSTLLGALFNWLGSRSWGLSLGRPSVEPPGPVTSLAEPRSGAAQTKPTTLVIRDEVIRKWAQRDDVRGMLKAA